MVGKVVNIKGIKETYNGSDQIKIVDIKLLPEGSYDVKDFTVGSPLSTNEAEEIINSFVFDIINPNLNRIVRELLNKHKKEFYDYPAAKVNHHDFAGGLAFHTIGILRLAKSVASLYDGIDVSMLYAGAILHDLGKTIELSGPIGTEYTFEGKLIGHISLIDEEIVQTSTDLGINLHDNDLVLLRHTVLAHHGLLEYGSPVRPMTLEAQILHNLDELDAQINMIQKATRNVTPGEFSKKVFGLENRSFFKEDQQQPEEFS